VNALTQADWLMPVHALGLSLLHFLWQGALIGVGYLGVRRFVPASNPELRYACGMVAIVLLALCPIATCLFLLNTQPATLAPLPLMAAVVGPVAGPAAGLQVAHPGLSAYSLTWLVALWLAGVLLMVLRTVHQWRSLNRIVRLHAILDPELQRMARLLADRLGYLRSLRVRVTDRIDTPTLVGWFRPVVLLPAALVLRFPRQQLELILAHEVGHLRRLDHLANLVQALVETLLFYHPVVHWISQEVRNDRELCCDSLVLRTTRHEPYLYARTLAELEEWRQQPARLAMAATGGHLLDRVRRIVGIHNHEAECHQQGGRPSLFQGIAVAALLAVIVTAVDRGRSGSGAEAVEAVAARPLPIRPVQIEGARLVAGPLAFDVIAPDLRLSTGDADPDELPPVPEALEPPAHDSLAEAVSASHEHVAEAPQVAGIAEASPPVVAAATPAVWPTGGSAPLPSGAAADATAYVERGWSAPDLTAADAAAAGFQPVELELHLTDQGRVLGSKVAKGDPFSPLAVQARREVKLWQFEREGALLDRRAVVRPIFVSDGGNEPRLVETRIEVPCQSRTGTRICRPWTPIETTVEFMRGSELLTADAFLVLRGSAG